MSAEGWCAPPSPLLPDLRKEADAIYHVRSWLNKIGIPDCCIRAEEPPAAGTGRSSDRIDLYILDKRVVIEVKQQGGLSRGPYERGTSSGRDESAYEQVCRYVLAARRPWLFYPDGAMGRCDWIGAVTDGHVWWVWLWPAGLPAGAEPEECAGGPAPCWCATTKRALPASQVESARRRRTVCREAGRLRARRAARGACLRPDLGKAG